MMPNVMAMPATFSTSGASRARRFRTDMNAPMANLPVVIFQFAMSPYDDWRSLAWGGALLVTFTVLLLNILSRTLFSQKTPR